jgi:hypothetical protein
MPDLEAIKNLITFISVNSKKDAQGKIRMDPAVIRKLVADDPDTAIETLGLYCKMAKKNQAFFEFAWLIAGAYQEEFDDDVLMLTVQRTQDQYGRKYGSHACLRPDTR